MIKRLFTEYFSVWWKIMARPIYFYTFMDKGAWSDKSFSFLMRSSWILAAGAAITAFFVQVIWILLYLIRGLSGLKMLIIFPVMFVLNAVFLSIIFFIFGGIIAVISLAVFSAAAWLASFSGKLLGGQQDVFELIKAFFYSSAAYLLLLVVFAIVFLVKWKIISYANFIVGENIIATIFIFYLWGLWSISVKKTQNLPRWKALLASLIPIILMVLLQVVVNYKFMPKIERWIV